MKIISSRMKISFIKRKFRKCRINLKPRQNSKSKQAEGDRALISLKNITIMRVNWTRL